MSSAAHEKAVFTAPPVDVSFTCSGNAVFVTSETGITNANYAVGASDASFAELYDNSDQIVLYLEDELASGSTVTIRWKKTGSTNPTVTVQQSTNNSTWTTATGSPFTVSSTSFVNLNIVLSVDTRYLRFTKTNSGDLQLESITYTNTTCNNTGGTGVPLTCSATSTSIAGNVFNDFNENGTYESASDYLGVADIIVVAVDSLGNSFNATTNSTGGYSITGLVANRTYRVEFQIPSSLGWLSSSFIGSDNGSTVQFLKPGNCADLGLNNPTDYCQDNPNLVVACYENGSGVGNTNPAFISIPSTAAGVSPAESTYAQTQDMGSVFGAAYDRVNKRIFVSSFLKRHSGFGPRGVDGVYIVDYSTASPSIIGGFDLQGVTPSNGGAAIDLGSITRTNIAGTISAGAAGDYQLPSSRLNPSVDLDAFGKVAKISYGDIDISEDGKTLWMVNLNQRALISVDISSLAVSTSNPNLLSSALVKQYPISSMTGIPTCTNGTLRPFALELYKNKVYLGCVCDAASSSTLKKPAELDGYVVSIDPANPTTSTTVVTFGFDHNREPAYEQLVPANGSVDGDWQRWMNTYVESETNSGFVNFRSAPQPVIADIEFKGDGSMILGVMDRFAHQQGWEQYRAISTDRNLRSAISAGDLLYFGLSGGTYTAELGENDTKSTPSGFLTNDGVNNTGEFFNGDYYTGWDASHHETILGGLSILKATNEISVAAMDPFAFNSQGITWMSLANGAQTRTYQVVGGTNIGNFGKGSALADLEFLCNPAPIEIGNYVWIDTDKDGVQDPGEVGLNGVKVSLYKYVGGTSTLVATTNTSTVNGQTGAYYFRDYQQYGTGFDTLALNTAYYVVLGETGGTYTWSTANQSITVGGVNYVLTSQNTGSGTLPDINDNDAFVFTTAGRPYTNYPVDTVTTGNAGYVNHTLDFGLKICPTITNPSATQTVCAGGSGANITVNTSTNAASSIRFVRFTTDQMAGSTPTAVEATAIYGGTVISTVTPTGASSPYTATYVFNAADFPSSSSVYYVYAILNPDEGATCRPTQEIRININNVTASVIGSDQAICSGGNPAAFTVTTGATGSGTLYYQWQSSTTNCSAGFANIMLATDPTYDVPAGLMQTTYYRVLVISSLNSVACGATSNCVTVTVQPNLISGISATPGACDPADNTFDLSFMVSFSSAPSGNISIRYGDITRSFATTTALSQTFVFTNLSSNGIQDVDVAAAMANAPLCVYSAADLVDAPVRCTPNCCVTNIFQNGNLENGTWTGSSTFISGVTATPLPEGWYTNMTSWGHNDGYWVESVNAFDGKRAVYLQDTIAPLDNYCIGQYLQLGTASNQIDLCSQYKICFEWASFNRSFPDGRAATTQPVMEYLYYNGSGVPFLPVAPPLVIPVTPVANQDWDYLTWTHTEYTFSLPAPPAGAAYVSIWLSDYRPSYANGILFDNVFLCNAGPAVIASTITGNQTVCSGGDPAAFSVTTPADGVGTLSYQWQSSTTGCAGAFTDIDGATSDTYDVPSGFSATTSYQVIVTSTLSGVACTATSNCVTLTIAPYPDFNLGLAIVCPGDEPEVTIGSLTNGTPATSTMKVNSGSFVPYDASPPNLTTSNGINLNASNTITVRNEHGCETAKNIAVPDTEPIVCPSVNLVKLPSGID
ncbi:MAG: hypothetical protein IPM82_15860 [Saprospiraceae bacterium]|nr:hypothetical protein [Saprospiraceae bacterium]